ncbi:MAG TPA: helix-turn-helix domain-containing protein [Myxococcales bacterium]|nr:helix-turn-helix domain-containing protein [Myxococcales bacterium]
MGRSRPGMDKPDVFDANCPSRRCLELISDKWAVLVIWALEDGTHRFGDLRRRIRGVSQKMLTQTLRSLERAHLVDRTVYAEVPPRVEYKLTTLGEGLVAPLGMMCEWAEKYFAATQPPPAELKRLSA